MANSSKEKDLLWQVRAENAEFSQEVKQLKNRVLDLAVFERAVFNRAVTTNATTGDLRDDQDLHKQIDLFTHFTYNCPSRRHIGKFDRSWYADTKCRACYDSSTDMDSEYWQPARHLTTLQKFPTLAKKETKTCQLIQMGPVGPDGIHGRVLETSKSHNHLHTSERVKIDGRLFSGPTQRPVSLRGGRARARELRRRASVVEHTSSEDMDTGNEDFEEDGSKQDRNGEFGKVSDADNYGGKDKDCNGDDSSEAVYRNGSSDHKGSYRESSSEVKAWCMYLERMRSTPE